MVKLVSILSAIFFISLTITFIAFILRNYDIVGPLIKKYKSFIVVGIPFLLGLVLLSMCFYTVDQTEYVVISTFGKPNDILVESGLRFKLPYPIQSVTRLSKETFSTTFGYKLEKGKEVLYENETKMITGDENIIMADLEVQWKISDPISYIYNTNNPKDILFNATSASLKGVIGSSTVDDVLTDGRAKIISDIRENLIGLSNEYSLGITIVNVNLQDVDLPTPEVDTAFKSVTDAREERLTKINNAQKYKNEKVNEVIGERDAILSKAEATKVSSVEKAKGDTARFNAILSEYQRNQSVTSQRLVIDTLKEVLKGTKLYIVDDSSSTLKYLPINTVGEVK